MTVLFIGSIFVGKVYVLAILNHEGFMRSLIVAAFAASLSVSTVAAQDHDPDHAIAGGGVIADGWKARPDRGTLDNLNFRTMGAGFHVTVGPAVILYRDGDVARGSYEVSGSFRQTSSLGHAHGYGLIIGGGDLQGEAQRYTYFLVRGDGVFLVKKRNGTDLALLSEGPNGWAQHDAIHVEDADGQATNDLSILVSGGTVSFRINGTEVMQLPASQVDVNGIAGMRINHNLDIHIGSFAIAQM
ncbi:MAG TPA: hypothetical protein VGA37_07200 [Gemmatimonadales bacterium]